MFFELSRCLRANLSPIAASDDVLYPVLHHDGKLRPLITLAKRSDRLPRVFEAVTVEAMMHGNAVERFDPGEFRKFVNEASREQDLRSLAGRAIPQLNANSSPAGTISVTDVSRTETDL